MIERLLLTLLILGLLAVAYALFSWWQRRVINGRIDTNTASLLYFGSESCAACPTQSRYIEQIAGRWANQLNIRKVDVDVEPETAVQFQILSLPTTMLLTNEGKIHTINYGLTNSHKLNAQIEQMGLA